MSDHTPRKRRTRRQDTRWSTSDAAYEHALPRQGSIVRLILDSITEVPQTCDELEVGLGRTHQSVSSALHQLQHKGMIESSGVTRLTRSECPAVVWRAKAKVAPDAQPQVFADSLFPMPPLRWRNA